MSNTRNKKTAQLSLFLIIIALALLSFGLFYFSQAVVHDTPTITTETDIITPFIESCMASVGTKAIYWVASHGGYYDPTSSIKNTAEYVPYYFYEGSVFMPSIQQIQQELSSFMNDQFDSCIDDFDALKKQGYAIETEHPSFVTTLTSDTVSIRLDYPITTEKQGDLRKYSVFATDIEDKGVYTAHTALSQFLSRQQQNNQHICLSCLINAAASNDFRMDLQWLDNKTYTLTLFQESGDPEFKYTVALKYTDVSCENRPDEPDIHLLSECLQVEIDSQKIPLTVEQIPAQQAVVNEKYSYTLQATGNTVKFRSLSSLFDIDESTGVIEFTPSVEQQGNHTIWIRVSDLFDKRHISFTMEIINEAN